MNLDRTFCAGFRCGKVNVCDRFIGLLKSWAKENDFSLSGRKISVSQYADHAGKCDRYSPIENKATIAHTRD